MSRQAGNPTGTGVVQAPRVVQSRGLARAGARAIAIGVQVSEELQLTPGSPFYDLMVTFVAATAGLTPVFDPVNYNGFLQGVHGVYPGRVTASVKTDLGARVQEIRAGAITAIAAENALCCMLANAAWERTPFNSTHARWRDPEVQYFRAVRNAASHGNIWSFVDPRGREGPELPAHWRYCVIDHTRKGTSNPLHGTQCFGSTLGSADLLRLLQDIEARL